MLKTMYLYYTSTEADGVDIYLGTNLLTAGKKALTCAWMMQVKPTVSNRIDVTIEIYSIENVSLSLH